MKSPLFLASILLITLLSLSITLPTTYAQDYTRWGLPEGATARLGKGEAYAIQFSSDGTQLAVASGAGIWSYDTRTGKEINLIPCTMDLLRSAAFSPDGTTLACGDRWGIWLWDVGTGRLLKTFKGHRGWVNSVSFSPDGRMLASAGDDHTVRLWNVSSGGHLQTLEGHTRHVRSVVFGPNGRTLAGGRVDGTILLWDVGTGRLLKTFKGHRNWVNSVSFSPDGRMLASGSSDKTVRLWDVGSGRPRRTLTGHRNWVNSVSFSPDGGMLASSSRDSTVRLWDANSGGHLHTLEGHTWGVRSVSFSPDGRMLASGSSDKTVRLWDANSGGHLHTLEGHTWGVDSVSFSPDGRMLASSSRDFTVRLWDVGSGEHLRTLKGHTGGVYSVSFSPDGRMLASGGGDFTVRLWDVGTGRFLKTFKGHTGSIHSVSFSPDGTTLASSSGGSDLTIRLWDVGSGQHRKTLIGHTAPVNGVVFSPDGRTLASSSYDATVRLWDVHNGLRKLGVPCTAVSGPAFSPDGGFLAIADGFGKLLLLDLAAPETWESLGHQPVRPQTVAFSPDGQTLASGNEGGTVLLWDTTPYISRQQQPDSQHLRNIVRLVYFRPSDRSTQPNVDTNISGLVKGVQNFYAAQMQRHGRKTFTFETDANGNAVVHHVDGQFTDAYYQNQTYDKVREEISKQYDTSEHVYLVAIDVSSEQVNDGNQGHVCGIGGGSWHSPLQTEAWQRDFGGLAVIPASGDCFNVRVTAHELGHAFGLEHDFGDNTYLMGYGSQSQLSKAAAEWLSVHRYFNTDATIFNETTAIEMRSSRTSQLQFHVIDADGLHQTQLLIPTTPNDPAPGLKLHSVQALDGKTNSALDFIVSELTGNPEVTLQVIDVRGNITKQTFSVETSHIVREDVNGDGVVNILDLTLVAASFGQTGQMRADVNGDGVVNIVDLVKIAGMLGNVVSAPSMGNKLPYAELQTLGILTAADVQLWLTQAQHLDLTDVTSQRGILFLEQLFATLIPKETVLLPNYPNPFNPETWIPYQLAEAANVTLHIYSAEGKLVRTLAFGHQAAGIYESRSRAVYWDGKNELSESVASGVYFYTLLADEFTSTRKMLIRK